MILFELVPFEVLRVIWWLLLGVLLIGFAVMGGRDLGVGALLPAVARSDEERRVLINLVGNARKYCDAARPVLTIRVRRLATATQIDLMDNGAGIPPDKQDLVFEKFSRLNDPARAGGAGLGLAISREVMAALGGSITYLPGHEGAAFRLELPLRPPGLGTKGAGA